MKKSEIITAIICSCVPAVIMLMDGVLQRKFDALLWNANRAEREEELERQIQFDEEKKANKKSKKKRE